VCGSEHWGSTHIFKSSGNVFKDLGFPPKQAEKLLKEADQRVANAVANKKRKPGKYKDPEARKAYMRELMRKRRAGLSG
jgi:hypothetical protein